MTPPVPASRRSVALTAVLGALASALITGVVVASPAMGAAATRTISGTVSLPSGVASQNLAAVSVVVSNAGGTYSADVGSDGRYRVDGIAPGSYQVLFAVSTFDTSGKTVRPNLVPEYWKNVTRSGDATPVDVSSRSATGINAALATGKTITGTVTVPSGTPSDWRDYVVVEATGDDYATSTKLASNGTYRFDRLPAGNYTVRFRVDDAESGGPNLLSEYYPDTTDRLTASPVVVSSGSSGASRINAALDVGGILDVTVAQLPTNRGSVALQTAAGRVVASAPVSSAGKASIRSIPAGTYFLQLSTFPSTTSTTVQLLTDSKGASTFTVKGNRAGVSATAKPATSSITGTVTAYGFTGMRPDAQGRRPGLGDVYVYQRIGGSDVLLPDLSNVAQSLDDNETVRYRVRSLAAGTYRVAFGPSRVAAGDAGAPYNGNGPVSTQWWRGGSTVTAATAITVPAGRSVDGIDGTIRPQSWKVTGTGFVDVSPTRSTGVWSAFSQEIVWLAGQGITSGYDLIDGTKLFKPKASISREAMAAFLYRAAGSPAFSAPAQPSFVDVDDESTAFAREIEWLAQQGISTGWVGSAGQEFRPKASISREAMAAFLYRWKAVPTDMPSSAPSFVDVDPLTNPFATEIAWLADQGVSTGWQGSGGAQFRPRLAIARDAMAAFLYRLLGS